MRVTSEHKCLSLSGYGNLQFKKRTIFHCVNPNFFHNASLFVLETEMNLNVT